MGIIRRRAKGAFVHVQLAQQDGAGGAQSGGDRRIIGRRPQFGGTVTGRQSGNIDIVLEGDRYAVKH